MKKTGKIVTGILSLVLIFMVLLGTLSMVFTPKGGNKNEDGMMGYIVSGYKGERKHSLDVVFCGNSDMYYGFSPMEMWTQYGIPSYTIGQPWQNPKMAYKRLKHILKFQKPKVFVLEVDGTFSSSNGADGKNRTLSKKILDNLANFRKKFANIDDGLGTAISFQFPLFRYHSRWSELNQSDFTDLNGAYRYVCKGYVLERKVNPYTEGMDYMKYTDETEKMDKSNLTYLNKIVELCKEKEIQLLLLEVPSASSWNYKKHNTMQAFADRNNLPFVDLNLKTEEMGFDWMTDTKDAGNHLNISGMQKVTNYISRYLNDNYALPDRRGEAAYQSWVQDEREYIIKKQTALTAS